MATRKKKEKKSLKDSDPFTIGGSSIVPVTPMSFPSGKLYHFDYVYPTSSEKYDELEVEKQKIIEEIWRNQSLNSEQKGFDGPTLL